MADADDKVIEGGLEGLNRLFFQCREQPDPLRQLSMARLDLKLAACGLRQIESPSPSVELLLATVNQGLEQVEQALQMEQSAVRP